MKDKNNNNTKSTFSKLFEPIFELKFLDILNSLKIDHYVKKLKGIQLITLLIYGQIKQQKSLAELANNFNNEDFCKAIDLNSISASQISRRLNKFSPNVLEELLKQLIVKIEMKTRSKNNCNKIGVLQIIDSSTIALCLNKFPWATYRKDKSGIKLHLKLKFWNDSLIPEVARITTAKVADIKELNDLVVEADEIMHVFDRGYTNYKNYDKFCETKTLFSTRLKANAIIKIISSKQVDPNGLILKDCIIQLGDGKNEMQYQLRMIEFLDRNGKKMQVITNNFECSAEEIALIYKYRWKIELFFKWLKQHFTVKHFFGTSPNAVVNQILISLISFCLLEFLKLTTQCKRTLFELLKILRECLYEAYEVFLQKILKKPSRTSKGRRKFDYKQDYVAIEREVFEETSGNHIDDLVFELMY